MRETKVLPKEMTVPFFIHARPSNDTMLTLRVVPRPFSNYACYFLYDHVSRASSLSDLPTISKRETETGLAYLPASTVVRY